MAENLLIFGGGLLQLSIINRAHLLGYKTIVIDPDENAPGKDVCDIFIQVAGNDYDKTLEIAKKYRVKGVVTAATDKPILMMCKIAKELSLPFPSYTSCETVLDKGKFKKFLQKHNLPHAQGDEYVGQIDIQSLNINYPVIIKPVMNSGSRGVIKCNCINELSKSIEETLQHCNDARYLIEEFIEGDEISVEVLVQNNKVHILQITDKIVTEPPYNVELGHIQPSKYEFLRPNIETILQKVVDESGLNNCALHPELKISGEKITIIEIGPRLGGDFITSHLVPLSTGVNIEDLLIKISVGKKITYQTENHASMVTYFNFPEGNKIINTITEQEVLEKFKIVKEFSFKLNIGDYTRQITNSLNRYGEFIIKGKCKKKLLIQKNFVSNYLSFYLFNNEDLDDQSLP
jgi:biotin carboxylase